MTTWPAMLDAIDEGLTSFPPVLVDLDLCVATLGPLPSALADRAALTLRRMAEAEAILEHHRSDLARELAALSALKAATLQTAASTVPHFLDTKA
jgi:hypothetical protein